jgi:hypothetical protein
MSKNVVCCDFFHITHASVSAFTSPSRDHTLSILAIFCYRRFSFLIVRRNSSSNTSNKDRNRNTSIKQISTNTESLPPTHSTPPSNPLPPSRTIANMCQRFTTNFHCENCKDPHGVEFGEEKECEEFKNGEYCKDSPLPQVIAKSVREGYCVHCTPEDPEDPEETGANSRG